MRKALIALVLAGTTAFAVVGTSAATPGNGKNALFIFNDCDGEVGQIALVNQASLNGRFATAHVVGSNRPAPLVSLDYDLYIGGELIESGGLPTRIRQRVSLS